ncbi:MAG: AAA family ATPase [Bacteroidota bacterium]
MKGKIILFRGFPGVGKTYYSDWLGRRLQIAIVRKDDIYDPLAAYLQTHKERNEVCYQVVYQIIGTHLQNEISLIIDYPFKEIKHLENLDAFVAERGGVLKSIGCTCSDEAIWAERFNKRAESPQPNQLIVDFQTLKAYYSKLYLEPYSDELVIDSSKPDDKNFMAIQSYVFS